MSTVISPSLVKIGLKTKIFYHYAKFCRDPFLSFNNSNNMHYKLNTLSKLFLIRFYRIFFLNMWFIHLKVHGTKQIIKKCTLTFMWNQTNHHKMYIDIYVCVFTKLRVILSSRQILTTKYLLVLYLIFIVIKFAIYNTRFTQFVLLEATKIFSRYVTSIG